MGQKSVRARKKAKTGIRKGSGPCAVRIELTYPTFSHAVRVDCATKQDNEGFVITKIQGRILVALASADTVLSLLHTVDDYLECVTVAEKIILHNPIHRKDRIISSHDIRRKEKSYG